ncbi:MAG: hypothetical protein K6G22_10555 [Lachnospiraceae bacterium]|nr:hypothetical protein [Lachnospiraceae bacterium]
MSKEYENDDKDALIEDMTQAMQEAIEVQEKYTKFLEELQEENDVLVEVILKHGLAGEVESARKIRKEKKVLEELEKKPGNDPLEEVLLSQDEINLILNGMTADDDAKDRTDTSDEANEGGHASVENPVQISLAERIRRSEKRFWDNL